MWCPGKESARAAGFPYGLFRLFFLYLWYYNSILARFHKVLVGPLPTPNAITAARWTGCEATSYLHSHNSCCRMTLMTTNFQCCFQNILLHPYTSPAFTTLFCRHSTTHNSQLTTRRCDTQHNSPLVDVTLDNSQLSTQLVIPHRMPRR